MKRTIQNTDGSGQVRRADGGVALIIAISFLGLFSLLGASYVRYMSLELESCNVMIRDERARLYAGAGVRSAISALVAARAAGAAPQAAYSFSYGVYGDRQGERRDMPALLPEYKATAEVRVTPLDESAWRDRFRNGPAYPGEARGFELVSDAVLVREVAGRSTKPLARHGVQAVAIARDGACDILYWGLRK